MTSPASRFAATAGAFAAAGLAGVAATRLKNRQIEQRKLARSGENEFGSVRGESFYVTASDDVPIHVEVDEGPGPTVVFVHGWMCDIDTWHFQRLALRGHVRMVFVEQRSHGRSGTSGPKSSTLAHLADDLFRVLEAHAPDEPIVLVGHSMGAMAIMQLAADRPSLFGERIGAVVLVSTSSGRLLKNSPALKYIAPLIKAATPALDWGREFNSFSVIKRYAFGPFAQADEIDMATEMIMRAPTSVVVNFYPNFVKLNLSAGFKALERCRVSVVCGTKDVMTPFSHNRWIARNVHGAELVPVADAGHMVMLEQPDQVTEAIERVLKDIS